MEEKESNYTEYDIPIRGSLGLLAAGYKGLMLWRMKKLGIPNSELKFIPPIVQGKIMSSINPINNKATGQPSKEQTTEPSKEENE